MAPLPERERERNVTASTVLTDLPAPGVPKAATMAASAASGLLALGLPIVVLQIYDRVLPNRAVATLGALAVTLLIIMLVDLALRLLRADLIGWAAARYEHRLGCLLTQSLLNGQLLALDGDGPGVHASRLSAIDTIKAFYAGAATSVLVELPLVLISLLLVAALGGVLVCVPLAFLAAFLATGALLGRALHRSLSTRSLLDERRLNFLIELLTGIHSVKALALEEQMQRRYERLFNGVDPAVHRSAALATLLRGISESFAQAHVVAVAAAAAWLVIANQLTLGEMAACTLLCGRTLQPVMQALGLWSQYQGVRVARQRLKTGLSLPAEQRGTFRREPTGEFTLEAVGLTYKRSRQPVFNDLSLHVRAGECVGISGQDGMGKTTLVNLITGLVTPDQGRILFDGVPLDIWDRAWLRSRIGVASERSVRFDGTLLDNLTLFQGGAMAVDQAALLNRLGIEDGVARLAHGWQTPVQAGSCDAPEDLLQRIGIARVLLRQPRLMIFDDANDGLDHAGDQRMVELLRDLKGRITIILIAQRPSILALADRRLVLDHGHLRPRDAAPTIVAPASAPQMSVPSWS